MNTFIAELLDAIYDEPNYCVRDLGAANMALDEISRLLLETDDTLHTQLVLNLRLAHKTFLLRLDGCVREARRSPNERVKYGIIENTMVIVSTWLEMHAPSINFLYSSGSLFGTIIPESMCFIGSPDIARHMFETLRHYILGECDYLYSEVNSEDVTALGAAFAIATLNCRNHTVLNEFFSDIEYFKDQGYAVGFTYHLEEGIEVYIGNFWSQLNRYVVSHPGISLRQELLNYLENAMRLTDNQPAFFQVEAIHYIWNAIGQAHQLNLRREPTMEDMNFPNLRNLRRFPRMSTRGPAPARRNGI